MPTKKELLEEKTVKELRQIAREKKLSGYSSKKKAELIGLLQENLTREEVREKLSGYTCSYHLCEKTNTELQECEYCGKKFCPEHIKPFRPKSFPPGPPEEGHPCPDFVTVKREEEKEELEKRRKAIDILTGHRPGLTLEEAWVEKWADVSEQMANFLQHYHPDVKISEEGFVALDEVLSLLQNQWPDLTVSDIQTLVERDPKERYEIRGEKIRVYKGHSDVLQALLDVRSELKQLRGVEEKYEELEGDYEKLEDERKEILVNSAIKDLKNLKESLQAAELYLKILKHENRAGKISDKEYQSEKKRLSEEKQRAQHKMLILKDWFKEAKKKAGENPLKRRIEGKLKVKKT